jgi:hypothetical protein
LPLASAPAASTLSCPAIRNFRGRANSPHIHGTHVPVEEPSTASEADIVPMVENERGRQLRRPPISSLWISPSFLSHGSVE